MFGAPSTLPAGELCSVSTHLTSLASWFAATFTGWQSAAMVVACCPVPSSGVTVTTRPPIDLYCFALIAISFFRLLVHLVTVAAVTIVECCWLLHFDISWNSPGSPALQQNSLFLPSASLV